MREYIALDVHKRYTLAEREECSSGRVVQRRIEHRPGAIREFLSGCEAGTAVAVEATGNWYWVIDEVERARLVPRLTHPRKAKLMMGMVNKTDKLDVHGLNRLQRNGTLPAVWVPPGELRDLRELTRSRVALSRQRASVKNRLHAILSKHGLLVEGVSDAFGAAGRKRVEELIKRLPEQTRWAAGMMLDQLDFTQGQLDEQEGRLKGLLDAADGAGGGGAGGGGAGGGGAGGGIGAAIKRLRTLPGVGLILGATIALEVGDVTRFASAERLASYAGTTPRVASSGGKTRYGKLRDDVNRHLKWAFTEAANVVAMNHRRWPDRHAARLYKRLKEKKGHAKAIGAVSRHLAEAAWHVLSRGEDYSDPACRQTACRGPKPKCEQVNGAVERGVSAVSS